jgi:hypothetical protein
MKKILFSAILVTIASFSAFAQTKPNGIIEKQIRELGSSIKLTYDRDSNVSKLMAVSENFPDAGSAGVQAMNFAIGFMYPGLELAKAPENVLLTFWVLTKKPRFGANHNLILNGRDIGPARYTAKPREDMEYLNFEISRADLTQIVGQTNASFKLGAFQLTFTRSQQKAISDLLVLSDPAR